jgi:hypothetical protein
MEDVRNYRIEEEEQRRNEQERLELAGRRTTRCRSTFRAIERFAAPAE